MNEDIAIPPEVVAPQCESEPEHSTPDALAGEHHRGTSSAIALGAVAAAALSACGGGDEIEPANAGSGNARAQAMAFATYGVPTKLGAWRFLSQATMGVRPGDVEALSSSGGNGIEGWLNSQLASPYLPTGAGLTDWEEITTTPPGIAELAAKNPIMGRPADAPPIRVPPKGTLARYFDDLRSSENGQKYKSLAVNEVPPVQSYAPVTDATNHVVAYGEIKTLIWDGAHGATPLTAYLWNWHSDATPELKAQLSNQQLRLKVTYALMQFLVVSLRNEALLNRPYMMAGFFDMLMHNAFGSYKDIIRGVATSPAMATYLSHLGNLPPRFEGDKVVSIPDQNFARELLQLFTIGLVKLNMDGTVVKDAQGNAIPTTGKDDIPVLSNALTGWAYDRSDRHTRWSNEFELRTNATVTPDWWFQRVIDDCYYTVKAEVHWDHRVFEWASAPALTRSLRFLAPLAPYTQYPRARERIAQPSATTFNDRVILSDIPNVWNTHSTQAEVLAQLKATTGSTSANLLGSAFTMGANPAQSLERALDRIFAHPNLAPFVAKQMIQHMVTSNPSPAYVRRVAQAFKDSNWSMANLVRAILLDTEARSTTSANSTTFGKLKDPYLRVVQLFRALGVSKLAPFETLTVSDPNRGRNLNQAHLWSPSVFNDYSPTYQSPGGSMASKGLVIPQMQLATDGAVMAYVNAVHAILTEGLGRWRGDFDFPGTVLFDGLLGKTAAQAMDTINLRLHGGGMSAELKSLVLKALGGTGVTSTTLAQAQAGVFIATISTEFLVQR
jgi:uncharacterized protein (DUF1800 family)